jgi:hypothetical protein
LICEIDQFIGCVAHCRNNDNDLVASSFGGHDSIGDSLQPFGISNGGAAVFLNNQSHGLNIHHALGLRKAISGLSQIMKRLGVSNNEK